MKYTYIHADMCNCIYVTRSIYAYTHTHTNEIVHTYTTTMTTVRMVQAIRGQTPRSVPKFDSGRRRAWCWRGRAMADNRPRGQLTTATCATFVHRHGKYAACAGCIYEGMYARSQEGVCVCVCVCVCLYTNIWGICDMRSTFL
jgi:hypothetical protein